MIHRHHTVWPNACMLGFAAVCLSCVPIIDSSQDQPFTLGRAAPAGDTISPLGPLQLYFSLPVHSPDSVHFDLQPAFNEYEVQFNKSHDTATVILAMPLQGRTRYRLRLASTVESTDGLLLRPQDDSISFVTYPLEQEPNDDQSMADTLQGTMFGSIATANDTDWFAVADSTRRSFCLVSKGSSSLYEIRDAGGRFVRPQTCAEAETLTVPADFTPPLYAVVYACNRSNGGYYKLALFR